ncbi:MAG: hypothetical protein LUC95_04955 [Lachnospiraceae bacterium]|nr:hypothetical protein [Lachnospiraceae bacterium]
MAWRDSSFLSAGNHSLGDGGDSDDSSFGIPLGTVTVTRTILVSEAGSGGYAGQSPATIRESRGNVWHTLLACKV